MQAPQPGGEPRRDSHGGEKVVGALPSRTGAPEKLKESRGSAGAPRAAGLLVLVEQRHAGEGPGARLALVLLDVRVGLEVGPQVGAVREGPAAVRAGEGLLPWEEKAGAVSRLLCHLGQQLTLIKIYLQPIEPSSPPTQKSPMTQKHWATSSTQRLCCFPLRDLEQASICSSVKWGYSRPTHRGWY